MLDTERFAKILINSRAKANVSQQEIADAIGVSRRTVVNWEAGRSAPDLYQLSQWFTVLGLQPLPYVYAYLYPNSEQISSQSSNEDLRKIMHQLVDSFTDDDVRGWLYVAYGNHGSVPHSVLQMMLAHLHSPMEYRVSNAKMILEHYFMAEQKGELVEKDHIKPEITNLKGAIGKGFDAAIKKQNSYTT